MTARNLTKNLFLYPIQFFANPYRKTTFFSTDIRVGPYTTRNQASPKHTGSPCPKLFGERCALEGLLEGVVSPNATKSASLVKDVPCRPLCVGYFHQTILNNSHEYTILHLNSASPLSPIALIVSATLSQPLLSTSQSLYLRLVSSDTS